MEENLNLTQFVEILFHAVKFITVHAGYAVKFHQKSRYILLYTDIEIQKAILINIEILICDPIMIPVVKSEHGGILFTQIFRNLYLLFKLIKFDQPYYLRRQLIALLYTHDVAD